MSVIKNIKENNIKYKIFTVNNESEYKYFDEYLDKFLIKNQDAKNIFMGLDFEFYRQQNRLWQICLYNKNAEDDNYVFIINSQYVNPQKILLNKCKKIIYGGDGLDLPYIFSILNDNDEKRLFMDTVFDLKLLCDYYRSRDIVQKCGYYNILTYFKILNENILQKLEEINKNMGETWNIQWNIETMSNDELVYSIYDVIYLRELLIVFYDDFEDKTDFMNIMKLHRYAISKRRGFDYKLKIKDTDIDKYRVIQYFKNL